MYLNWLNCILQQLGVRVNYPNLSSFFSTTLGHLVQVINYAAYFLRSVAFSPDSNSTTVPLKTHSWMVVRCRLSQSQNQTHPPTPQFSCQCCLDVVTTPTKHIFDSALRKIFITAVASVVHTFCYHIYCTSLEQMSNMGRTCVGAVTLSCPLCCNPCSSAKHMHIFQKDTAQLNSHVCFQNYTRTNFSEKQDKDYS